VDRLLERDRELARMRELLQDAARGTGCCVAVVGPAGIGKTSLLAATRALGSGLGLDVLDARGASSSRTSPTA
jgi:ABC-type cobalamin transport system ATPase subunit